MTSNAQARRPIHLDGLGVEFDPSGDLLSRHERGGNDTLLGADSSIPFYLDGSLTNFAMGDAHVLAGFARGGNDVLVGGAYANNYLAGDGVELRQFARGGNDLLLGGAHGYSVMSGDAWRSALDDVVCGDDTLVSANAVGYADQTSDVVICGFFGDAFFFGPEDASVDNRVLGGDDILIGGSALRGGAVVNGNYGDAGLMSGHSRGGDDTLIGGYADSFRLEEEGFGALYSRVENYLKGDAEQLGGHAIGGNDLVIGGASASSWDAGVAFPADITALGPPVTNFFGVVNFLSGDTGTLTEEARCGNDTVIGGAAILNDQNYAMTFNFITGDAGYANGNVEFGSDKLYGGSTTLKAMAKYGLVQNVIFGDVGPDPFTYSTYPGSPNGKMANGMVGGSDLLVAGDGFAINQLFGDAYEIESGAQGGRDTLVGGDAGDWYSYATNLLVGDARYLDAGARGGADRLISGTGSDRMYGDAVVRSAVAIGGADVFVFAPISGSDFIMDFSIADRDRIDFSALRRFADFRDFGHLAASGRMHIEGYGVISIDLELGVLNPNAPNHLIVNVIDGAALTADSFIF